jgi:hypothetical protein
MLVIKLVIVLHHNDRSSQVTRYEQSKYDRNPHRRLRNRTLLPRPTPLQMTRDSNRSCLAPFRANVKLHPPEDVKRKTMSPIIAMLVSVNVQHGQMNEGHAQTNKQRHAETNSDEDNAMQQKHAETNNAKQQSKKLELRGLRMCHPQETH